MSFGVRRGCRDAQCGLRAWVRKCVEVRRHVGRGEKRSVSARMHQCGAKGVVGAQDVHTIQRVSAPDSRSSIREDSGSGLGGRQEGRG